MNDTSIDMKKGSDESGRTHEEANVTPRESTQEKGCQDGTTKAEMTSLKRMRGLNTNEASDSSLEDQNDGVPSTDTSATNQGAPVTDGGGGVSDQMRLEERRAYNRRNAARSRQRVKDQLRDLQQQVIAQTASRSELERTNVRLLAENNVLRDEVHKLRTILSGAPLFGQQQQSLQPFLQQPFQASLGGNAQFLTQGTSHQNSGRPFQTIMDSTGQPGGSQIMLPNATTQQQQIPYNFYSSTQNQMQQEQTASAQSFATPTNDGSNNQSAMVQLLLQQIMNNNNTNNSTAPHLPTTNGAQEQSLQLQQQQIHQQPDNSFAAFMAFVGAGAGVNAPTPSAVEGKALESQQQSASNDGQQPSSVSTQSGYPLLQQQQFDQLNVQELQQSFLSQHQPQQQQQQQPYVLKEEENNGE